MYQTFDFFMNSNDFFKMVMFCLFHACLRDQEMLQHGDYLQSWQSVLAHLLCAHCIFRAECPALKNLEAVISSGYYPAEC